MEVVALAKKTAAAVPLPKLSFAVSMPVPQVQKNQVETASAHLMARWANAFASRAKGVLAA